MTEVVTVVKDRGKTAVVEIRRAEKCAGCGRCAFNRRDRIRVTAIKDVACTAGDRVVVALPEKDIVLAPLFLFALPVLFMLAAVVLCRTLPVYAQIAVIAAALGCGFAVAFAADRIYRKKRRYMPVITEKYTPKGEEDTDD